MRAIGGIALRAISALFFSVIALAASNPTWGTLRPHNLISARAATPHSPFFGFAYHPAGSLDVRHLAAETADKISSFAWTAHNGRNFGDQVIRDEDANLLLTTTFYAHPSHPACTLRISATPLDPAKPVTITSAVMYAVTAPDEHLDQDEPPKDRSGFLRLEDINGGGVHVRGIAPSVGGPFSIHVSPPAYGTISADTLDLRSGKNNPDDVASGEGCRSRLRFRSERPQSPPEELGEFHVALDRTDPLKGWAVEKAIQMKLSRNLRISKSAGSVHLLSPSSSDSSAHSAFVQRLLEAPFHLEATLIVDNDQPEERLREIREEITGSKLDRKLAELRNNFDEKFENVFGLKQKGYSEEAINLGKHALANLLGGIGYFYGSSIAKAGDAPNAKAGMLASNGLYTATPSRVVFPRGFLWDEGFHQLIIQRWDPDLSARCLQSWFKASQENGWIPREQILGLEARERFPDHIRHLMIQDPTVANPPTILMPIPLLWSLIEQNHNGSADNVYTSGADKWGEVRNELMHSAEKYYKWIKSTQSGERPMSFRWKGRSNELRSPEGYPLTLSSGLDDYPRGSSVSKLERHVDLHCWITWASRMISQIRKANGKDSSAYEIEFSELLKALHTHHAAPENSGSREDLLLCDYDGDDRVCHEGYVTVLPLVLGLLDENDDRVGAILEALENRDILRADAGVRSLSRQDRWHRRGNDYWTGSIWMPFNFLTLAALKTKYGVNEGKFQKRAMQLYSSLRASIVENTMAVYTETGLLWENYSPDDGKGKSGRQFTGWTSLILLIMSEKFDGVI